MLGQTRAVDEVLVVDDGSTDGTPGLVRRYAERGVRLVRRRNGGPSAARNTGLRKATGDWVALLDGDDQWLPEKLDRVVQCARAHPEAVAFFSPVLVVDGFEVEERCQAPEWVVGTPELLRGCCIVTASSAILRRDAAVAAGGFDEAVRVAEDWVFWLRLAERGPIRRLPGAQTVYYLGEHGLHTRYVESRAGMTPFLLRASWQYLKRERWRALGGVHEGLRNHFGAYAYYASCEGRLGLTLATGTLAAVLAPRAGGYVAARCLLRAVTGR